MTGGDTASAEAAPAPDGRVSLWRHRNFMLLWGGQSVSLVGSAVSTLALPLVALTVLRSSTFQIGALSAAGAVPAVPFGLPAGALVDRWPKRRLMIWCDVVRALALASVPAAAAAGRLTLAQLYAVALVTGAGAVFFDAAHQSCLPRLVSRQQLMQGNSKLSSSAALALLVGPSLGGFLVALVGAAEAVSADALSPRRSVKDSGTSSATGSSAPSSSATRAARSSSPPSTPCGWSTRFAPWAGARTRWVWCSGSARSAGSSPA